MKRKSTEVRKKEILSYTRDIIFADGPAQFTMRKLAKQVGITEAGIYRHFESKKEIYLELIDTLFSPWTKEMTKLDKSETTAPKKIKKISEIHLNFLLNEKLNPILFISESMNPDNEEITIRLLQRLSFFQSIVQNILKNGIEEGSLKDDLDIQTVSACFISVMQSAALQLNIIKDEKTVKSRMKKSMNFLPAQIKKKEVKGK